MNNELTFGQLETMIDAWATDLNEYYNIFINQSEEFKNVFWGVNWNNQKINLVSTRLGVLNYMHQQLEERLVNAHLLEQNLENIVIKLEQSASTLSSVDISRQNIYGLAENISCSLNNCKDDTESTSTVISLQEAQQLKNPMEQVAKVMVTLLEALEYVEMKTEQLKNELNYFVGCVNKGIFCSRCRGN